VPASTEGAILAAVKRIILKRRRPVGSSGYGLLQKTAGYLYQYLATAEKRAEAAREAIDRAGRSEEGAAEQRAAG
jgi:hypothetical protein